MKKKKLFYKKRASKGVTKAKLSTEYNKKAKLVKDLIKQSIESYELNIINKCKLNPKLLYKYINDQKKCKSGIK